MMPKLYASYHHPSYWICMDHSAAPKTVYFSITFFNMTEMLLIFRLDPKLADLFACALLLVLPFENCFCPRIPEMYFWFLTLEAGLAKNRIWGSKSLFPQHFKAFPTALYPSVQPVWLASRKKPNPSSSMKYPTSYSPAFMIFLFCPNNWAYFNNQIFVFNICQWFFSTPAILWKNSVIIKIMFGEC